MEESSAASGSDKILEGSLTFSYKRVSTILSIYSTSRYLLEKNETICPYKDLYTNVNSFIYNSQ